MKKCIALIGLILATILTSSAVHAQIRFVNTDGSALGDICIASVDSRKTVDFLLRELGMSPIGEKSIRCNGKSLRNFAAMYNQDDDQTYIFNVGDQTPESKLCIGAISSEFMVGEVIAEFFSDKPDIEENIRCNGLSLKQFVSRYKDHMLRRAVSLN